MHLLYRLSFVILLGGPLLWAVRDGRLAATDRPAGVAQSGIRP